jgi:transposase
VLQMVDIEFIRKKHFVEDWSIRQIARQLKVSRQSVRKAIESAEMPKYHLSEARPNPVMDPYRETIVAWLDADEQAPKKQRHTARRIYQRLIDEHGFVGAESTVRRFVAQLKDKRPEAFVPLEAAFGQQAQIDWGQATVEIAGESVIVHLFCVRLRASGVPFVWAAPTEKLEAFLEGHCRAFSYFGGAPRECVYDNPKTAVTRILAGPEREEHRVFSSLRAHYLFESLFCRPAEGHEKGAVENLVGYVRRNALVPVQSFQSWEALNAHLLGWCEREKNRRAEDWSRERVALRSLPARPFRAAILCLCPVNKLSLVTVDCSRYSVPCDLVGRTLQVALFTDRVDVSDGKTLVATHPRSHRRGHVALILDHYLPAIARKPRAASHAAVVSQMPAVYASVRDELCSGRKDGYREFAAILLLHREFAARSVERALVVARERGCLNAGAIRQMLINEAAPALPIPVEAPGALAEVRIPAPDLAQYDSLASRAALGVSA